MRSLLESSQTSNVLSQGNRSGEIQNKLEKGNLNGVSQRVVKLLIVEHAREVLKTDGNWGMSAAVGLMKGFVGFLLVVGTNHLAHRLGQEGVM